LRNDGAQVLREFGVALRIDTCRAMMGAKLESSIKAAYAAARGIPLRTAQDRAKKGHPDYVAFRAAMGAEAVKARDMTPAHKAALVTVVRAGAEAMTGGSESIDPHVAPPALATPRHLWTPEQYAECMAWTALVEANAQRDAALKRGDPVIAMGYVRIAGECLRAYHAARAKRVQADLEAGRLKPMAAWQAAKSGVLKIVALLAGLEGELAQAANPDNPIFARKAIGDWKERKWNPAVRGVIDELSGALAS
jgi:hypothetical protein